MPYATASDETKIFYDVRGGGEPLVLLSGQANHHGWWDGVRGDFDAAFRTVAPDHRGTGSSGAPREAEYSIARFAADVAAVLDDLGVERAHVYGTSMGGKVAQRLAADHPDRVGALVLGCTSPGGPNAVAADPGIGRALGSLDRAAARRTLIDLMFNPGWAERNPGSERVLGDPGMAAHARRGHLAASRGHDAWDDLPRITAPTLVLHGTDDVFAPVGNALLLAERIPGARLLLLDGARHAYFEEQRETAGAAVLDFLREHPLGG
ncbi:alpha/beta fold hydrolase [Nocardiopsis composta]|uniref:Pimeloyl-ACP methyl ester carboxylesterase n=1 Tax=Nocardiopsis composta TaxID=157465 RepID=A0A7W8QGR3_9ACTN|nr:alpha/beta fold hydrolase [Nocardiopsis composta]MBB5430153.1 pimeloyl-ACP methyl ester carboxylesterase [Nocardiopsis composta]